MTTPFHPHDIPGCVFFSPGNFVQAEEPWSYPQPPAEVVEALATLEARSGKPTLTEVRPFVRALYEVHPAGGSLHIVLDDDNVRDDDVRYCIDSAREKGDRFGELLARVILRMSKTQRLKLGCL